MLCVGGDGVRGDYVRWFGLGCDWVWMDGLDGKFGKQVGKWKARRKAGKKAGGKASGRQGK